MERDDLIVNDQYSVAANHSEESGKKIRKKIVFVTVLLSVITMVEVGIGATIPRITGETQWTIVKWFFIILTLVKAGYIVMSFMHLGDERKNLRNIILIPYGVFILYLIFIALTESNAIHDMFY